MIKRLKYIFIPVLAVLLMSYNVSAVEMAPNVHPIWTNANPLCSFYNPASNTWVNNAFSNNSNTQDVTYIVGKINCDYPAGLPTKSTYAVYSFRVDNYWYNDSADSGILSIKANLSQDPAKFGVIGVNISAMGSTGYQFDVYLYGEVANPNGGTIHLFNNLNDAEIFLLKPKERITFVGASYWQVSTDTDFEYNYTDVLAAISSKVNNISSDVNSLRTGLWTLRNDINEKLGKNNEHYQKEEQAADDISDQSPSDIGNSENTATTNLVGALSGFFTTIANAPATNCLINGDLGNLDIGGIDLCKGKEHFNTLIEFIGFTALFGVVFWASYHLIKKTLALVDWARSK